MFGKLGELGSLLQKVQTVQQDVKRVQAEMAEAEAVGTAGNGMVEVIAGGDFTVKRISISNDCLSKPEPEALGELIREAVNLAFAELRRLTAEKMREVTGDLDLPGLT
jgi:nucleoid-associated protein EbfC